MNKRLALALCALACTPAAAQQGYADPTRPPAGLQAAGAASAPAEAGTLVLQSVLLGKGRTPAAVINGRLVALGGTVGELRLSQVSESSVKLKGPQGSTTLTLTPDAQKTARNSRMELAK